MEFSTLYVLVYIYLHAVSLSEICIICLYLYIYIYVIKFMMQIICYELLGLCFYFPEQLLNFRKIETKSKQLKTNNLHQEFNNICLNENLLPIYTNLYTYILYNFLIRKNKPLCYT